jgi:protoporphyrinogen oxidase
MDDCAVGYLKPQLRDSEEWDVIVVGAGPAGLTAGYLLTKNNAKRTLILEADPEYVGGISRTERHRGYSFDIGGHRFFTKSKAVEEFWAEILPHGFPWRSRSSKIFFGRKFYAYPLHALEALSNLGAVESALCVLSYAKARMRPVRNPASFHEWVANQFGERFYRLFFKSYTEKVWGISCDELSADWAAQRIKGLNLATAVISALFKPVRGFIKAGGDDGQPIKTLIERFRYPHKGPGMMWEAAKEKFLAQGGRLLMGTSAVSFAWHKEAGFWEVTAQDATGSKQVYRCRDIVSSAPLRDVILATSPTPACSAAARGLGYRDFILVALMLDCAAPFASNWVYIHEPGVRVGRIQNFAAWSAGMVPGAGKGCLGLEYFCNEGDGLWTMPDEGLIDLGIRELEALGLGSRGGIASGKVVRQPKAYPVYSPGYEGILNSIQREFASEYPHMHFVGRNGMHRYNNQDHAVMTAMLAVQNILAGRTLCDVWQVNEDAGYHEEIVAGSREQNFAVAG